MSIYTVAIQKGGTGKTTTAATLAQAAAYKGKSCLAIDLDPQGNLTYSLAADPTQPGSKDLLHGAPAADLLQHSPQGMDVIPASRDLAAEASAAGSARRLQNALEPVRDLYDIIIIDTPPTAGELQYNALQAANGLVIPLLADAYNVQALYQITDTAAKIRESNPQLQIAGLLLTQYDGRSIIARQMRGTIIQCAASLSAPFLGSVRAAVAVKEAAALQKSLYQYAPKSKPAQDYLEIFAAMTAAEEMPQFIKNRR